MFTYTNAEPYVRFAAEIRNPATQTRVGVRTSWKALDANGVIVGTFENAERPAIPAGGSIYYVGGAGSARLTGTPATVKVEISDPGTLTATPPATSATVESPTFKRADFDLYAGAHDYNATFVIAAAHDLKTSDLSTAILLKDAAGKVVGAEFADTSAIPSALKSGEKANATGIVEVAAGEPTTVEAYVYG